MNKLLIVSLFLLVSCGRYAADRQTVNFAPLYQPEIELANTDNNPGTIFNPARGNLFSMESDAIINVMKSKNIFHVASRQENGDR